MSQQDNAKKTEEFYALLLSDFEAAKDKYFAEDIVWENPLPDSIPFGGVYKGVDGLLSYLGELSAAVEMTPLHFTDIVAQGDVVAAIGFEEGTRVRSTGKFYSMPFVHVLRFNTEGKVAHIREYNDTCEMLKAFQA